MRRRRGLPRLEGLSGSAVSARRRQQQRDHLRLERDERRGRWSIRQLELWRRRRELVVDVDQRQRQQQRSNELGRRHELLERRRTHPVRGELRLPERRRLLSRFLLRVQALACTHPGAFHPPVRVRGARAEEVKLTPSYGAVIFSKSLKSLDIEREISIPSRAAISAPAPRLDLLEAAIVSAPRIGFRARSTPCRPAKGRRAPPWP